MYSIQKSIFFLFNLFLHVKDLPWICMNGQILDNESLSIHLNLFNIGSEICEPSLIIYIICIRVNFSGNIFLWYLQELMTTGYKTIKSQTLLFLWGEAVVVVLVLVVLGFGFNFWIKIEQVRIRWEGRCLKFGHFVVT